MSATRTSISFPEEMKDALTKLAKEECRSLSGYIQKVLRNHLISKGINPVTGESKPAPMKKSRKKRNLK